MRVLDLYCGPGGAGKGYNLSGFEVVGVDIDPQPSYPFPMIRGDALDVLESRGRSFDLVHASPPCHAFTALGRTPNGKKARFSQLGKTYIQQVRDALLKSGRPYVIENVEGSPLSGVVLCGAMFGLMVSRHRIFETSFPVPTIEHVPHSHCLPFREGRERDYADFMGCHWVKAREGRQCIPPAYTRYIGKAFRDFTVV